MKLVRTDIYKFELPYTSAEVKDAIKFLNKELYKLTNDPAESINWWIIKFKHMEENIERQSFTYVMEVELYKIELNKIGQVNK